MSTSGDLRPAGKDVPVPTVDRFWHQLYIDCQADPYDTRSDVDFCTELGLELSTFRNWKNKYRTHIFQEVEKKRKTFVNELRSKGHKALAKKLDKDTNAIKLLFQLLGDLVEKTETKVDMSHDDKARRIDALLGQISKRQADWKSAKEKESGTTEESKDEPK